MAVVKKVVGDLLRLRMNLSGGESDRFIRAFFYSTDGQPMDPPFVDLPNLVGGIYGENAAVMPNAGHFDIQYLVYLDSDFGTLDMSYSPSVDSYERDTFDPSRLVEKPFEVIARFNQDDAIESRIESNEVFGVISSQQIITARVEQSAVRAEVRAENDIEGKAE